MKTTVLDHWLITEAFWYEPVLYDVANTRLLCQYDGCGGFSKYSVAGKWPILVKDSWFTGFTLNGKRPHVQHRKRVNVIGRMMEIDYERFHEFDVSLKSVQFCGDNDNAIYIRMIFTNHGQHSVNVHVRQGMEFDTQGYLLAKLNTGRYVGPLNLLEQWDDSKMKLVVQLAEDYIIRLECSHPCNRIQREGKILILDHSQIIEPGQELEMTWGLSGAYDNCANLSLLEMSSVALQESQKYAEWLQIFFQSHDETLNALATSCMNAAYSSYKRISSVFSGLYAGVNYQSPPRTYYRDGYWTSLPLLPFKPEWVREEILTLAQGIEEDGTCPSAVIYNTFEKKFEPFWQDHYDSPSFFVMLVHDYLAWTHDLELLQTLIRGKTIWEWMRLVMRKLERLAKNGQYLMEKPDNRRDWCDNIDREGLVTYDGLLQIHAARCMMSISGFLGEAREQHEWKAKATHLEQELRMYLWQEDRGYFNYKNSDGKGENNVSIEQTLAVIFDIGTTDDQQKVLDICTSKLETNKNDEQPYGDWGVMVAYPQYTYVQHLIEKSMDPFRYHNGSDWPYWDGILAWAKFRLSRPDWRYPLTRWFTYSLERHWLTPVEYFDPIRGKGSDLQGWSAMPVAAILFGGLGLWPTLDGELKAVSPPWGDCSVKGIHFRGAIYDITVKNSTVQVIRKGEDSKSIL